MTLLIGGEVGYPAWLEIHEILMSLVILLDADPARQSEGREYSRRERDTSRTRGEENGFERRRRDRSPPDDDTRKWRTTDSAARPERRDRDDREKERRGREASSERADTDARNSSSPTRLRRKTEDDERAEARRRKEDRDREKETPAWMDDYVPDAAAKNTLLGISNDGMDELQRWKQEKREKEMRKEAEAAAIATLPTPPEPAPPLVTAHTSPPPPTNGHPPASSTSTQDPPPGISFLEQLKQAANQVNVEVSPPQDQSSSFAPLLSSAHVQYAETNSLPSGPPSATLSPTTDPVATAADIRRSNSKSTLDTVQIPLIMFLPCRRLQPPSRVAPCLCTTTQCRCNFARTDRYFFCVCVSEAICSVTSPSSYTVGRTLPSYIQPWGSNPFCLWRVATRAGRLWRKFTRTVTPSSCQWPRSSSANTPRPALASSRRTTGAFAAICLSPQRQPYPWRYDPRQPQRRSC